MGSIRGFSLQANNIQKGEQKEHFIVKAKIIDEKRNYCKVEIISKQDKNHILQLKEIWKISKEALK